AERSGEPAVVAACLGSRSGALFHLGRRQESVVLARVVAKLAEELGDLVELSVALLSLSVYLLGDDPVGSASIALRAAEVARRVGRRDTEVMNLFNAAETSVYLGRWDEARTAIVELEERVQTDEDRMWLDTIAGLLSALTGEGDRGQEMMTRYAGEAERTEFLSQRTTFHTACAMVRLSRGDLASALTDALKSVELDPNGINAPLALAVCARAQLWQGDVEGVTACLEKMAHTRGRWTAALRLTLDAGLTALGGDRDASIEKYRGASEAWSALGCSLDQALCELDAVVLLGPELAGTPVVESARGRLAALGAVPFLEALEQAVADRGPAG
ncbi:MAG: hypothetical protein ACRDZ6_12855, partial [Acidimicrobiales bacterium]